jgi:hypothetical protein
VHSGVVEISPRFFIEIRQADVVKKEFNVRADIRRSSVVAVATRGPERMERVVDSH